jgi:hypothetical protein
VLFVASTQVTNREPILPIPDLTPFPTKKLERQSSRSRPIGFRGVNFRLLLRRMWLRSQACAKNIAPMAIVNPMILSAFVVRLPTDPARKWLTHLSLW